MSILFEYDKSITGMLCESIIDQFYEDSNDKPILNIPKNNKCWERIERILYKELLMKLNQTKMKLLDDINLNNDLLLLLNKSLYTKHITVQKLDMEEHSIPSYYFTPNRYNVLTYVFYLNDITEGGEIVFTPLRIEDAQSNRSNPFISAHVAGILNENWCKTDTNIIIKPKMGKLVLFQEDIKFPYKCILPKTNTQYIITGQLCYDNVV